MLAAVLAIRAGLLTRRLFGACSSRENLFLDLLVNPDQPFLGAHGATLRLLDLHLQLIDAVLGDVQLK
jgi:hypothetical protein